MLALDEVKAVPLLTLAEAGRHLAGDVPPVKEVESRVGYRTERRVHLARLPARVRVWIQALALLKGSQIDDGGDVGLDGVDPERLPDRAPFAVVRPFTYREARISRASTRSLRNQTTLFSDTSSPSLKLLSAQKS